jgi:hypothetical protein
MQVPAVQLTISSDGRAVTVHPGGLIGRLAGAEVMIADPRVSEAHALVSLRSRTLKLLALRGGLTVGGREVDAVTLVAGLQIELAEGLFVTVARVDLPTHTLVLCGAAQGPVELGSSSHSLLVGEEAGSRTLRLVAGFVASAVGHVWCSGARLWIRLRGQEAEAIEAGGQWEVEGCKLRAIRVPLDGTRDTVSEGSGGGGEVSRERLVIVARYTSVHVQRDGATAVLTGKPANLVSELVRFGGKPVPWEVLSRQIWGERSERDLLRDNFDATCGRLRRQLRELTLREDLVTLDGSGNVELVLYPGDRIVDET